MNRAKQPKQRHGVHPNGPPMKLEKIRGFKKSGRNVLQKAEQRRMDDERMRDGGAFYFLRKTEVDRMACMLTDGTRHPQQVGAAASKGCALKRAAKRAGVPNRTASFHARRHAWRTLLGDPDAEPELEVTRQVNQSPVAPRYTDGGDPRAELKQLIDHAMAEARPRTKRWTEVVDGKLVSREKMETLEDMKKRRPTTVGEFVDRFPNYSEAVARLLRRMKNHKQPTSKGEA